MLFAVMDVYRRYACVCVCVSLQAAKVMMSLEWRVWLAKVRPKPRGAAVNLPARMMAARNSTRKRNYLPLEKCELIRAWQNHPGTSVQFDFSKTQVAYILKNKASFLAMYEANESGSRVHARDTLRVHTSEYADVNNKVA